MIQFFKIHPNYDEWVKEIWIWKDIESKLLPLILPAYEPELVYHLSAPPEVWVEDHLEFNLPKIHWVGPQTRKWRIQSEVPLTLISIRFYPGALYSRYAIKGIQILNQFPKVEINSELIEEKSPSKLNPLDLDSMTHDKIVQFGETILNSISTNFKEIPVYIRFAILELMRSRCSIAELSKHLHISRKQLERKFKEIIGMNPSVFQKIHRLMEMIREPNHYKMDNPESKMTDIAYNYEYTDQSHFNRDFKDMVGSVPTNWFKEYKKMSHFYNPEGPTE